MLTRTRDIVLALGIVVALSIAGVAFCGMEVECPYCHNSDGNVKGNCVLRQKTGYCPENYYPEHCNKSTCPWCDGKGRMSRLEAWAD